MPSRGLFSGLELHSYSKVQYLTPAAQRYRPRQKNGHYLSEVTGLDVPPPTSILASLGSFLLFCPRARAKSQYLLDGTFGIHWLSNCCTPYGSKRSPLLFIKDYKTRRLDPSRPLIFSFLAVLPLTNSSTAQRRPAPSGYGQNSGYPWNFVLCQLPFRSA